MAFLGAKHNEGDDDDGNGSQQNKFVVLMSNVRPQDTLNNFSNPLPDQFLHPYYKHRIAVSSISLHTEFKSAAVPRNSAYPVIIQMFRKDWIRQFHTAEPARHSTANNNALALTMFRPQDCYYIDTAKSYTNEELHLHLNNTQVYYNSLLGNKFKGFPSQHDRESNMLKFGQFEFPFKGMKYKSRQRLHQTFLLMHQNFVDVLELTQVMTATTVTDVETSVTSQGEQVETETQRKVDIPGPKLEPVYIGDEKYFWFLPVITTKTTHTFVRSTTKNKAQVQVPKLLYVLCPNVVPGLVDGAFQPLLKRFPLIVDAQAEYVNYHFKNLEFVDTVTDISDSIHITLCDEFLRKLRLTPGFATQVSLIVQSRPQHLSLTMNPRDRFVVHVNSRPTIQSSENLPHKFTVELPKTLHFETGQWEVALSHIIFPTKMERLPTILLTMTIELMTDDDENVESGEQEAVDNNTKSTAMEEDNDDAITVEAAATPKEDVVTFPSSLETCQDIVEHFKKAIEHVASVETWPTGPMCLTFKQNAKIRVSSTLAYILGYIDMTTPNAILTIDSSQAHPTTKKWLFPHRPQMMQLHPASLYLYSDHLCDYSYVGDKSRPLLAIVKVPHKAGQPPLFVDHEVKDEVYHPVMYNHVKTLSFYITSHDDAPVLFANDAQRDATVFLTLAFKRSSSI